MVLFGDIGIRAIGCVACTQIEGCYAAGIVGAAGTRRGSKYCARTDLGVMAGSLCAAPIWVNTHTNVKVVKRAAL